MNPSAALPQEKGFRLDFPLIISALGLVTTGVLLLFSASSVRELNGPFIDSPPGHHAFLGLIGLVLMLIMARLDYRLLGAVILPIYLIVILLLVAVPFIGESVNEARRWLNLGLFLIQPSEIAKPILVVMLAKIFADNRTQLSSIRIPIFTVLLAALPATLVFIQPDLGTTVIFGAIWAGIAIMAGIRVRHLALISVLFAVAAPLIVLFAARSYMRDRLLLFLNPELDPLGAGYNILQSEISVGSGGLFGRGLFNGTQSQLNFLRIQKTDFIFSVLGEELGFIGAIFILVLFAILLFRGLHIASHARDDLGRNIAIGIVMMFLCQIFINIGVNIRLLPVTGIPLPFLSYGGSSLLTSLLALGVLQSIYVHRRQTNW